MKLIISHDVDHLSVREHSGDLVLPKFFGLCGIELLKGNISFGTFGKRLSALSREDAWNNLEELIEFDREHGVKSTFFVAVENGLGISYDLPQAGEAINLVKNSGFDLGVHGIAYEDGKKVRKEHDQFKDLSGREGFGARMHYLRKSENTLRFLKKAGYSYDSSALSEEELKQPYFEDGLLEFPIHLEDMRLFSPFHRSLSLREAKEYTKDVLERTGEDEVLNVLLHPRYFSDEFPRYKKWYEWLVNRVKNDDVDFASYEDLREQFV